MTILSLCLAITLMTEPSLPVSDRLQEKLELARTEYDNSIATYEMLVTEYFDKRESSARELGDKRKVDQIKNERSLFEHAGELPIHSPLTLRIRPQRALLALSQAYADVVKEYTRESKDALAEATQKELAEIKAKAGFPLIAGKWQEGPEENQIVVSVSQQNEKFTATCQYRHKQNGTIRWRMAGTISKDGTITGKLEHTKAPRGFQNQDRTATYSAGDGKISGRAEWDGGGHDFEWTFIEEE